MYCSIIYIYIICYNTLGGEFGGEGMNVCTCRCSEPNGSFCINTVGWLACSTYRTLIQPYCITSWKCLTHNWLFSLPPHIHTHPVIMFRKSWLIFVILWTEVTMYRDWVEKWPPSRKRGYTQTRTLMYSSAFFFEVGWLPWMLSLCIAFEFYMYVNSVKKK